MAKSQNSSPHTPVIAILRNHLIKRISTNIPYFHSKPEPMAQVRLNKQSRPALLQQTIKFNSYLFIEIPCSWIERLCNPHLVTYKPRRIFQQWEKRTKESW